MSRGDTGIGMSIPFALYDSFATKRFSGNVAGVVVAERLLDSDYMRAIASELGAPTTGFVFVREAGSVRVRFFTPRHEIDACGHATLAVVTELAERGWWTPLSRRPTHVNVATNAGLVPLRMTRRSVGFRVEMAYRPRAMESAALSRDRVKAVLAVAPDPLLPLETVNTGLRHLIVPFRSIDELSALRLDAAQLRELAASCQVDSICAFVPVSAGRLRMRDLTVAIGATEEPASGTTSAALVSYAAGHGLLEGGSAVSIEQGVELGRPSRIEVQLDTQPATPVAWVTGQAIKSASGHILLDTPGGRSR